MTQVRITCQAGITWQISSKDGGEQHVGNGDIDLALPPGRYDVVFTTSKGKPGGSDWFEVRAGEPERWYIRGAEPWPEPGAAQPAQPRLF